MAPFGALIVKLPSRSVTAATLGEPFTRIVAPMTGPSSSTTVPFTALPCAQAPLIGAKDRAKDYARAFIAVLACFMINWFLIVLVYFLLLLSVANVAIIPQFMRK